MAKRHVLAVLAASAISVPAFAADTGGYLVGMVGQTKAKDVEVFPGESLDDTGTGIKLGGGYAFHRNVGVEAAYVDLGKATITGGGQKAEFKSSGLVVTAVGMLPLNNQVTLLGRLGFIDATVKATAPGVSEKSTKVKTTFGIGASYNFTPQFAVRGDFDRYSKLGDNNTTGESDVDMISVGVVYKF
jgi:OOP family OmpA-OmpF porin